MNELILLAAAQAGGNPPSTASCIQGALPLLLMFAVFYFLLIRPQQKRQKELREMLSRLKKGDKVVTTGGLIGFIAGLTEREVTLEVAEKVKVQVQRHQVALYSSEEPDAAKKGN